MWHIRANRRIVGALVKYDSFDVTLWWKVKNYGREESRYFHYFCHQKSEIPFLQARYLYSKENDLFLPLPALSGTGLNVIDLFSVLFITQAVSPQRSLLIRLMVSFKTHMVWGIYITQYPIDFVQKRDKPRNRRTVSYLNAKNTSVAAGVQYWTTLTLSKL